MNSSVKYDDCVLIAILVTVPNAVFPHVENYS